MKGRNLERFEDYSLLSSTLAYKRNFKVPNLIDEMEGLLLVEYSAIEVNGNNYSYDPEVTSNERVNVLIFQSPFEEEHGSKEEASQV